MSDNAFPIIFNDGKQVRAAYQQKALRLRQRSQPVSTDVSLSTVRQSA